MTEIPLNESDTEGIPSIESTLLNQHVLVASMSGPEALSSERITAQRCMVCNQPIKHGQIISGARMTPEADEVVGHYGCIVQMLGPEKAFRAILARQLPTIDPGTLVDGRVPGWEKLFGDDPR